MGIEILLQFIRPELLILVAVLWGIGFLLKKAPWFTGEWKIPFLLWALGIVLAILYLGLILNEGPWRIIIFIGFIQGSLITFTTVFFNETIKQVFVKRLEDNFKKRE
jgi:hypothetical protein